MLFTKIFLVSLIYCSATALVCYEGIVRTSGDGSTVSWVVEKHNCRNFCVRTLIANTHTFHYENFTCDKDVECDGNESYREEISNDETVERISWCCKTNLCNRDNTTFVEQKQLLLERAENITTVLTNETDIERFQINALMAQVRRLKNERNSVLWTRRRDVLLRNRDQLFYQTIVNDEALIQAQSAYAITYLTFFIFCIYWASFILFLMVVSVILGLIMLIIYYSTSLHHLNLFGPLSIRMWDRPANF